MNTADSPWRANPVLWLTIVLPATAVVASFASLYASVHGGDVPLPDSYHWEGQALASDEAALRRAATMAVSAQLRYDVATHECEVSVVPASADSLELTLTHPTEPALDQRVRMRRDGPLYRAVCNPPALAHWWVQLRDLSTGWMLRGRFQGNFSTPQRLTAAGPPS